MKQFIFFRPDEDQQAVASAAGQGWLLYALRDAEGAIFGYLATPEAVAEAGRSNGAVSLIYPPVQSVPGRVQ